MLAAHPCADPQRVILTGSSMGGAGAFSLGAAAASRFAGVSPFCGYGGASLAAPLAITPVYVVHGINDAVVSDDDSAALVAALRAAGKHARALRPHHWHFSRRLPADGMTAGPTHTAATRGGAGRASCRLRPQNATAASESLAVVT